MGLCKCPKKKVTNLFCFEHRVNVCEHCLVSNHPKCIVQSYLQWLQDSDYSPQCNLCGGALADGDVVRLICYDVFHWSCLNSYAQTLPANTAPAGYTCPKCNSGVFPPPNMVSPVADTLKTWLSQVNWARAGLGLPLIEEHTPSTVQETERIEDLPATTVRTDADMSGMVDPTYLQTRPSMNGPAHDNTDHARQQQNSFSPAPSKPAVSTNHKPPHSTAINMSHLQTPAGFSAGANDSYSPRKLFDSTKDDNRRNTSFDHDENKYKRRSALNWFSRWFKSVAGTQKKDPDANLKRFIVMMVLGLIAFLTFIVIMTRVGRAAAENDPFLDPMANPNIRVGHDMGHLEGPQ
ncbi:Zinc finger protein-like 1 [Branchiostoma belcheri]|nr:Zinc finger protein-like 1 [Branchiostoma belcheri]